PRPIRNGWSRSATAPSTAASSPAAMRSWAASPAWCRSTCTSAVVRHGRCNCWKDSLHCWKQRAGDLNTWWVCGLLSHPIPEHVAIGARLDVAAEAKLQLRPVERRLLHRLLGVAERLDLEHHEGVAGDVGSRQ